MERQNYGSEVKKANIVREMKKHSLNIFGLSEVKWKKSGDCYFEGYRFISVGGGSGEHGVAIILDFRSRDG